MRAKYNIGCFKLNICCLRLFHQLTIWLGMRRHKVLVTDVAWLRTLTLFSPNPLLLRRSEKKLKDDGPTWRLTLHLSASAEFDLNINPAISMGKSMLSGSLLDSLPSLQSPPPQSIHPSTHLHHYSLPPCCLLGGVYCKMWWKRLIQIIRCGGPSAPHSWYVFPAFEGLIRKHRYRCFLFEDNCCWWVGRIRGGGCGGNWAPRLFIRPGGRLPGKAWIINEFCWGFS